MLGKANNRADAPIRSLTDPRHGFSPSKFQILPLGQLVRRSFDEITNAGHPVDHYDPEHIRDLGSTVFLRADRSDYNLSNFLGILVGLPFRLCAWLTYSVNMV